ncbi:MAG: F0F1 ATP synthase subunit delta [Oscillatoriophycideae cyanobacterium NC_groundwater_1537_Pr4_S-0.65um_50_18]|nr:F0F1 ATP synthase subunit delta [Oscillatoriophycideae cyanobacterium NC_groundwater_1537_Pr4_S-0.65um_50_18]
MKSSLVAAEISEPYAQALMSVAQSSDQVDRIGEDVGSVLSVLSESQDLRTCLASPLFEAEVKKRVIRQVFGDQLHSFTLNFILLLVDRGRILFVEDIFQQFQVLLRQLRKAVLAEVTSAVALNEEQQNGIRQKVLSMTQAEQVELALRVDPDLMGGVIIKVGSQVVDASLRTQLRRIGMKLGA